MAEFKSGDRVKLLSNKTYWYVNRALPNKKYAQDCEFTLSPAK